MNQQLADPQTWNSYSYARNNPLKFVDKDGEFIFLIVAVWAVAEIALSAYDAYETVSTLADPNASLGEKLGTAGLFVAGALLPGGGYAAGGKQVAKGLKKIGVDDAVKQLDADPKLCRAVCRMDSVPAQADVGAANVAKTQGIKDQDLREVVEKAYRPQDKIPGGTASALRYEALTGNTFAPTSPHGHFKKTVNELLGGLNKINIRSLNKKDYKTFSGLLRDLENSLNQLKRSLNIP